MAFRVFVPHGVKTTTDAYYPFAIPTAKTATPLAKVTIPDCDRLFAQIDCVLAAMTPEQRRSKDAREMAEGIEQLKALMPNIKTPEERSKVGQVCREVTREVRDAFKGQPKFLRCMR